MGLSKNKLDFSDVPVDFKSESSRLLLLRRL